MCQYLVCTGCNPQSWLCGSDRWWPLVSHQASGGADKTTAASGRARSSVCRNTHTGLECVLRVVTLRLRICVIYSSSSNQHEQKHLNLINYLKNGRLWNSELTGVLNDSVRTLPHSVYKTANSSPVSSNWRSRLGKRRNLLKSSCLRYST